MKKQQK